MKKNFGFVMAVAALVMVLAWIGPVQAYEVIGDVTSGWGTEGGNLWYDVLKETATSSAGGYDGTYTRGVIIRPPTTPDLPNPLSPTNHNWIEVDYILATGRGGQRALFSVGEIDPRFGNGTVTLTLNKSKKDYDLAGEGRWVRNVSKIDVVHAFTNMKSVPGDVHPYSPMLVVSGAGISPRTYDLADLQAMTQATFDASLSGTNTKGKWTGSTLVDVLKASGIDTRDMDSYVIVQATDGYATLLSMYEVTHNSTDLPNSSVGCALPLLAIRDELNNTINNGTCTDPEPASNTPCRDGGFVRTVLPNDLAAGRWVSNTAQIIVYKLEGCKDLWR
jgi:hypothetical protein